MIEARELGFDFKRNLAIASSAVLVGAAAFFGLSGEANANPPGKPGEGSPPPIGAPECHIWSAAINSEYQPVIENGDCPRGHTGKGNWSFQIITALDGTKATCITLEDYNYQGSSSM